MSDETCTPECYKESHCFTCVTRQFARERDTSKRLREALERIRDERTWIDVDEDVKRCRWCGRPSGEDTTDCPVYIARAALSTSTAPAPTLDPVEAVAIALRNLDGGAITQGAFVAACRAALATPQPPTCGTCDGKGFLPWNPLGPGVGTKPCPDCATPGAKP